ncbi:TPA: Zn-ribbon domain-containing OB-fold protein [Candidatus Bathyarchaeota archaeon]|nr:Zn-ribbon domain-containing OB-fold protein [Candidatus Bathyarchaeota archaeon]
MGFSPSREWREIGARYRLEASKCEECGRIYYPPRELCAVCRRKSIGAMKTINLPRKGKVVTYSVIHAAPISGFEDRTPYIVAIVDLGGVKIQTLLTDCEPREINVGDEVEAVFRRIRVDGESGVIHYGTSFRPVRKNKDEEIGQ